MNRWLTSPKLLLDLLSPPSCPAIQSSTLLLLVSTLLSCPANTRTFESLDGLLVVTSLFKSRSTSRDIKLKLVEFLYFYLMPETSPPKPQREIASATNTAVLGGRGRELVAAFERRRETVGGGEAGVSETGDSETRTTEEKQRLLGKHLSNVKDLVEDLREGGGLFGGSV
jgi:hypothetical protein